MTWKILGSPQLRKPQWGFMSINVFRNIHIYRLYTLVKDRVCDILGIYNWNYWLGRSVHRYHLLQAQCDVTGYVYVYVIAHIYPEGHETCWLFVCFVFFLQISGHWNVSRLSKWKEKCPGGQVQAIDLQEVKRLLKHIEAASVWLSFELRLNFVRIQHFTDHRTI